MGVHNDKAFSAGEKSRRAPRSVRVCPPLQAGARMRVTAVGFDIGQTLIDYKNPLNWKLLYPPALLEVMRACQIDVSEYKLQSAMDILLKYNTRENEREYEVASDDIFYDIFNSWRQGYSGIGKAKEVFFSFFQTKAVCFHDTEATLAGLSARGVRMGFLTDVAYGMDNVYSLKNMEPIKKYFSAGLTSVDVGFRKPNKAGYIMLAEKLGVPPERMLYVGDEEKDVAGANRAGIKSALINRSSEERAWGQDYTIHSLREILKLVSEEPTTEMGPA